MNKCIKCGSYAFNLHKDNIDQGSLCDVHYWQGKAHRAEAQPQQEPVAWQFMNGSTFRKRRPDDDLDSDGLPYWKPLYTTPPQRTAAKGEDSKAWVGLTDEDRAEILNRKWWNFEDEFDVDGFLRLAEAKLKEKNT